MIAAYIDELIMFCVGLWASGVGYGFLQMPSHSQAGQQAWLARISSHLKWIGPLLLIIAVVLAVAEPH
jgi:hypothetical protein